MTVRYENGKPVEIVKVLISTQHGPDIDSESVIKPDLWEHVVEPVLHADYRELYTEKELRENLLVNPTGKFEIGGPMGDAGLTGRKIIVDTYGGAARHGGGAFSGKDPSKVDRSAAYAARYVAKNVVAAGLADRCEVQVAYAIGVAHPQSLMVETYGTERVPKPKIVELVDKHFDLRPGAIIRDLDLRRPIFRKTAAYGHFGREDHDFTWEKTDKADALRREAGLGQKAAKVSAGAGRPSVGARAAVLSRRTPHVRQRARPPRLHTVGRSAGGTWRSRRSSRSRTARALRGPFDYRIPHEMDGVGVGSVLLVPFGRRRVHGLVVDMAATQRAAARAAGRAARDARVRRARRSWSSSGCGSRTRTARRRRAAWRSCCRPAPARARDRGRRPGRASCSPPS